LRRPVRPVVLDFRLRPVVETPGATSDRPGGYVGQTGTGKRTAKRERLGKSVKGSFRELGESESNANNRCCAGDIGSYRLGLRRLHYDSPKESPRYRPDPSDKESARDHPDPAYRVLGRRRWRRNPDLCRPAQDQLEVAVRRFAVALRPPVRSTRRLLNGERQRWTTAVPGLGS
jgi:hypothetical protein